MTAESADIAVYGFAAATVVHAVFAGLLLRGPKFGAGNRLAGMAFAGAVLASVAWTAVSLADQFSPYVATRHAALAVDWLRYGLWLLFLTALLHPDFGESGRRRAVRNSSHSP